MVKQQLIEAMATIMCEGCLALKTVTCPYNTNNRPCRWVKQSAHVLYHAGYCSEKEIAQKVLQHLYNQKFCVENGAYPNYIIDVDDIKETAELYGVEVE